jgi:hypothetical protein
VYYICDTYAKPIMTTKKIIPILFALIFGVMNLYAQHVKPVFKRLVWSSYEPASDNFQKINIVDLLEINADGLVHLMTKYKGIGDTTYHLSAELVNKLNAVFDGNKKLTTYMTINKLPEGSHFAGALQYLYYINAAGKKDELIFIPSFMDSSFYKLLNDIYNSPSIYNPKVNIIHNPGLATQILKFHKACSCAPKIEQPPAIMEFTPAN